MLITYILQFIKAGALYSWFYQFSNDNCFFFHVSLW